MKERRLSDIALDNYAVAREIFAVFGDDEGKLNLAGYHLQQSVELYLKDFLESNGIEYRRSHSIEMLLAQCREAGVYPDGYEYLNDKSEMFTAWESNTRYIKDYFVQKEKVENALTNLALIYAPLLSQGGEQSPPPPDDPGEQTR